MLFKFLLGLINTLQYQIDTVVYKIKEQGLLYKLLNLMNHTWTLCIVYILKLKGMMSGRPNDCETHSMKK